MRAVLRPLERALLPADLDDRARRLLRELHAGEADAAVLAFVALEADLEGERDGAVPLLALLRPLLHPWELWMLPPLRPLPHSATKN